MEALSVTRRLLFPSPRPPHYDYDSFQEHLIWIPKQSASQVDIPCLWLPFHRGDILVLFSHGNGCDIGSMHDTMQYYHNHWRVNMLVWEYPGYGCCEGTSSEASINQNMRIVYEFATGVLNWPSERIILYGQSIGTGPVCWLASQLNRDGIRIGGVILQSPYTGIKDVVKYFAGALASSLISNRWSNIDEVKHIQDPFLCIHGQLDQVIPYQHSEKLYDACGSAYKHLLLVHDATHNEFDHQQDIITPISLFFDQYFRKYSGNSESREETFVLPLTPSASFPTSRELRQPELRRLPALTKEQLDLHLDDVFFVVPQAVIDAARARQQAAQEKEASSSSTSSVSNFFTNLISSSFRDSSTDTDSKHAEAEYADKHTSTKPKPKTSASTSTSTSTDKPKATIPVTKKPTTKPTAARPKSATPTGTSPGTSAATSTGTPKPAKHPHAIKRVPSTRVEMVDMSKPDDASQSQCTTPPLPRPLSVPTAATAIRPSTAQPVSTSQSQISTNSAASPSPYSRSQAVIRPSPSDSDLGGGALTPTSDDDLQESPTPPQQSPPSRPNKPKHKHKKSSDGGGSTK